MKIWWRTSRTCRSSSTIRMSRCAMSGDLCRGPGRDDLVLARALGGVERLVGGAEEVLGGGHLVVGEARDAERGGHRLAVREGGGGDDLPDPIRVEPGAPLRALDQQDRELGT